MRTKKTGLIVAAVLAAAAIFVGVAVSLYNLGGGNHRDREGDEKNSGTAEESFEKPGGEAAQKETVSADEIGGQDMLKAVEDGDFSYIELESVRDSLEAMFHGAPNNPYLFGPEDMSWIYRDLNGDEEEDLILKRRGLGGSIVGVFTVDGKEVRAVIWDEMDIDYYSRLCGDCLIYRSGYNGLYNCEELIFYRYDEDWNRIFVDGLAMYYLYESDEREEVVLSDEISLTKDGLYCLEFLVKDEWGVEKEYREISEAEWLERYYGYTGEQYEGIPYYYYLQDQFESAFSGSEKISKEDWFIHRGKFYVKTGEDVYKRSVFPEAVQSVKQAIEHRRKAGNRLIMESEDYFYIYDFETERMEEYWTKYGHFSSNWQVYRDMLYFVEETGDDKTRLMAYDMASGNVEQIDTGEYEPAQFEIRSDGAIGMWGVKGEGDKKWEGIDYWKGETYYCFWEDGTAVYVADKDYKDGNFGWTVLRGFTKNGIILEREYDDLWRGTKTYIISKDGKTDLLESISDSISDRENPKTLPEGSLIFEDERIVAVDMTSGLVKTYDYDLSCTGELQWDIEVSEDMEFVDYKEEGDEIWGIWKLADEKGYKRAALME